MAATPTPTTESSKVLTADEASLRNLGSDYTERYGFHDAENYLYKAPKGLNREIVEKISEFKSEPQWMRDFRLKALEYFLNRPQPTWGSPMLADVDYDDIHYFVRASERSERSWDDVPEDVKKTFDRLGIPEAERNFLAGVGAQYESEVVYHQVNEELEKQGVIFTDMDTALREHEDLVKEYFATIIPPNDNKLAALNSAVWSGGSFVYVPPGVHVEMPLQAYFRINTENMGQFERTIIIADEGSYVHYVEGCTAPTYSGDSLHSAVVELIAKPGARIRYTTVQNWSNNVYNLVTKRAIAETDATVEWVDCNLGSKLTMKYPSVYLMGERAHGEVLSIAFAGEGQHQDAGAKIVHAAPNTTSNIFAKSIS
ncbi:MAG TPA: Fe-S cluster assembly protein SufB, partial [Baekduia sp.]|nr:Fe-S cluster assembly protein SufB [Baekduia sp.]